MMVMQRFPQQRGPPAKWCSGSLGDPSIFTPATSVLYFLSSTNCFGRFISWFIPLESIYNTINRNYVLKYCMFWFSDFRPPGVVGCSTITNFCTTIRFDIAWKPATFLSNVWSRCCSIQNYRVPMKNSEVVPNIIFHCQKLPVLHFGLRFDSWLRFSDLKILIFKNHAWLMKKHNQESNRRPKWKNNSFWQWNIIFETTSEFFYCHPII